MMSKVFVATLAVLATCTQGFVLPSSPLAVARAAPQMTMSAAPKDVAAAATVGSVLAVTAPVQALEGTGVALGMDYPAEFWVPLSVIFVINLVFFQWTRTQAKDDFFGEYDERR